MAIDPIVRLNPYVGPRAFRTGETLYGRDREVDELLDLLIAERIVLLYSPSGAGKTSLVQAALVPRLREEDFFVGPSMRVNAEVPSDMGDGSTINRFVLSALLSREEGLPADKQTPLEDLARATLVDHFMQRLWQTDDAPQSEVIIFDQFEEIITTDPTNLEAKTEFFNQVGQALRDKNRWALFSMREDHLAALDPYLRAVPTRLATRFRLDLLGEAAARTAMREPARLAGVDFTNAAASKLVDDLRQVRVQRPDGTTEEQLGPHVEPVQLQVVCYRLCDSLSPGDQSIEESDIASVGDVDSVLAAYYAERVADTSARTGVAERTIRDWFDTRLITEQGIRAQVLWGGAHSDGLPNAAIDPLIDAHLVRSEKRRGAVWFELAHDRLITPIRKNNSEWRDTHLNEIQRRAVVWDKQNRPGGLLLRGGELTTSQLWADEHAGELTPIEREFLDESRKAREIAEREKRRNRLIARLAVAASIVSLIAFALLVVALFAFRQATLQQQLSVIRQLVAQSGEVLDTRPRLSLLLALQALKNSQQIGSAAVDIVDYQQDSSDALRRAFVNVGGIVLAGHNRTIWAAAFSPDNQWAATAGSDGVVRLWNLNFANPAESPFELRGHEENTDIRALAFSPDTAWLLSGGDDGTARLWNVRAPSPPESSIALTGHSKAVRAVAFSPDGRWFVTGSSDNTARLWDIEKVIATGSAQPEPDAVSVVLAGHQKAVLAAAFSADVRWLATGSADSAARLWDVRTLAEDSPAAPITLGGHTDSVSSLVFDPKLRWLATGSDDAKVRLWDLAAIAQEPMGEHASVTLSGNEEPVLATAFSHDGRWLATGGFDRNARLWDMNAPQNPPIVLYGHTDQVSAIAFSPDDRWLITTGRDATVRLWDLDAADPAIASVVLRGHEGWVRSLAVSADSRWVITSSEDRTARLWGITLPDSRAAPVVLRGHTSIARAVVFSGDERWLATGGGEGVVRLWDMQAEDPAASSIPLPGDNSSIFSLAISADSRWLATGGQDANVRLWDLKIIRPNAKPRVLAGHTNTVRAVTFSRDGHWLVSASRDATIRLWDLSGPVAASTVMTLTGHTAMIRVAAITDDSRWLVTAGDNGETRLWDLQAPDPNGSRMDLSGHSGAIRAVAFSHSGRWLVTGGDDRNPRLWDVQSIAAGAAPSPIELRDESGVGVGTITAAAFTFDDRWLATAGLDNIIRLWDVTDPADAQVRFWLRGHNSGIRAIAITHDDRWLLSGSEDNTARVWDLKAADPSASSILLPGHTQPVWGVGISPDDRWLATGSGDATIRLWTPVSLDDVVALTCPRIGRNMSSDEWRQALGDAAYQKTCPDLPAGEGAP